MKDLTLVIPAKNEAESLPVVLNEIKNLKVNAQKMKCNALIFLKKDLKEHMI